VSALPANFDLLSPLEKRAAIEKATGLSWAQYSALPGEQKTAVLLSLKGYTYQGGTNDMLGAAKTDALWNRVGGWVSGMGAGLKIALVLGLVAVAWAALPALKTAPSKLRRAVA
jgi:hypothetical protein